MKTFKQFITEDDDSFEGLDLVSKVYDLDKPIYRIENQGSGEFDVSMVYINDIITEIENYKTQMADWMWGLGNITVYKKPFQGRGPTLTIPEATQLLKEGELLQLAAFNLVLFCTQKQKIKQYIIDSMSSGHNYYDFTYKENGNTSLKKLNALP